MKNNSKKSKKLSLSRESVRALSSERLSRVGGGTLFTADCPLLTAACPTRFGCTQLCPTVINISCAMCW